jgi:hypothetical protein
MPSLRYYVSGRLFEWSMTLPMLGLSAITFYSPRTLQASAFQWIVVVMPIPMVEILLFLISFTALVGLLLNGHSIGTIKIGPLIRAIAAVGRAVMWAQFSLALIRLSVLQGYMSPGVPFWMTFVATEMYVAFSAAGAVKDNERAN